MRRGHEQTVDGRYLRIRAIHPTARRCVDVCVHGRIRLRHGRSSGAARRRWIRSISGGTGSHRVVLRRARRPRSARGSSHRSTQTYRIGVRRSDLASRCGGQRRRELPAPRSDGRNNGRSRRTGRGHCLGGAVGLHNSATLALVSVSPVSTTKPCPTADRDIAVLPSLADGWYPTGVAPTCRRYFPRASRLLFPKHAGMQQELRWSVPAP